MSADASEPAEKESHDPLSPIELPCGRVLQNRLVKVAMYEHLATLFGGPPNQEHFDLYSQWSKYPWGMIITGNVQVCPRHLTLGRDMVVPEEITDEACLPFQKLAKAMRESDTLAIMQLSHAGRQSPNILGGRLPFLPPSAPSPVRVGSSRKNCRFPERLVNGVLFQTPREMSARDISDAALGFIRGITLAAHSGFDGAQLHVAHGYLLAQFLSPKTNHRTDTYSLSFDHGTKLLHGILTSARVALTPAFVLGIKINAADYVGVGAPLDASTADEAELRAWDQVSEIASWDVLDFIEISGGDYENPDFMSSRVVSESPRQAFFSRFSHQARLRLEKHSKLKPDLRPRPLILLTGGLRSPAILHSALSSRQADLLGLGRAAVMHPDLPTLLAERKSGERDGSEPFSNELDLSPRFGRIGQLVWERTPKIKLIGAGANMAWYIVQIRRLASASHQPHSDGSASDMGGVEAVVRMWLWMGPRTNRETQQHEPWTYRVLFYVGFFCASLIVLVGVLVLKYH